MPVIYRYRQERHFGKPPAAIWPFVSDTARLWELNGNAPFQFEERVDSDGRVRRFARGKAGPIPVTWEEDFGEWQENRRLFHAREYQNGPMRRFEWGCELFAEREGCRLVLTGMAETVGLLGFVARHARIMDAEFSRPLASIERLVRESDNPANVPGTSVKDLVEPAARRRLDALAGELARDPASHGLAPKLSDFLRHAPVVALRSIRPIALAKNMVRPTRPCRRIVPGGGAERHRRHGLGFAVPAVPRGEVPREPAPRSAERRALFLMQHRLRTQFQPQCRIDLPS